MKKPKSKTTLHTNLVNVQALLQRAINDMDACDENDGIPDFALAGDALYAAKAVVDRVLKEAVSKRKKKPEKRLTMSGVVVVDD